MQQAIEIWRRSDQSDQLEGIENDPVFGLLITALAYQANEIETDIEQMKTDLLEDFAHMLTPYEIGHAIPATAAIQTMPVKGVAEMVLDSKNIFNLGEQKVSFVPLLRTRLLNATVKSIVRLDSRRWKATIDFMSPISDLSEVSFCIRNQNYRDVAISIDGQQLPLVKPWDFSELPMSSYFNIDSVLYNQQMPYMASPIGLDLFAHSYGDRHTGHRVRIHWCGRGLRVRPEEPVTEQRDTGQCQLEYRYPDVRQSDSTRGRLQPTEWRRHRLQPAVPPHGTSNGGPIVQRHPH